MLKRDIEVRNKFLELRELLQLFERHDIWIEIEESVSKFSSDLFYPLQKLKQSWFSIQVGPVSRSVLRDHDNLFDSRIDHLFHSS